MGCVKVPPVARLGNHERAELHDVLADVSSVLRCGRRKAAVMLNALLLLCGRSFPQESECRSEGLAPA